MAAHERVVVRAVGGSAMFASQQLRVSADENARPGSSRPNIRGDFAIRYDDESMVSKIDLGGQDQAVRYASFVPRRPRTYLTRLSSLAEFVTKALDNSLQGFTVSEAMKYLGLQQ